MEKKEKIYLTLAVLSFPILILGITLGIIFHFDFLWFVIIPGIIGCLFLLLSLREMLKANDVSEIEKKENDERLQKILMSIMVVTCFGGMLAFIIYGIIFLLLLN